MKKMINITKEDLQNIDINNSYVCVYADDPEYKKGENYIVDIYVEIADTFILPLTTRYSGCSLEYFVKELNKDGWTNEEAEEFYKNEYIKFAEDDEFTAEDFERIYQLASEFELADYCHSIRDLIESGNFKDLDNLAA